MHGYHNHNAYAPYRHHNGYAVHHNHHGHAAPAKHNDHDMHMYLITILKKVCFSEDETFL